MHDWALAAGRVGGKVRQHHVASRGSVGLESPSYVTVRERSAVWQALHEAVAHHHIDADKATNLMATLQVRVPYPTPEQVGAAELQQAEHDAAFWQSMHGQTTKQIDLHKKLIATRKRRSARRSKTRELRPRRPMTPRPGSLASPIVGVPPSNGRREFCGQVCDAAQV